MGGVSVGTFGANISFTWSKENGAWSKYRVVQDQSNKIIGYQVIEKDVSNEEYFKRKLARTL